jgi:Mn-dependent DtxR family transcriptional regulator
MPTSKQKTILEAIPHLFKLKGFPPTLADIAEHTGIKKSTVQSSLKKLRKDNVVTWEEGKQRTLKVV